MFNYLQKLTQRWVRNTWVNPPLLRGVTVDRAKNLRWILLLLWSQVY